jgi:hypothetical protein
MQILPTEFRYHSGDVDATITIQWQALEGTGTGTATRGAARGTSGTMQTLSGVVPSGGGNGETKPASTQPGTRSSPGLPLSS